MSIVLLSSLHTPLCAQSAYDSLNLQLREMFSPLAKPANPKHFLYEMVAHASDSSFYSLASPDTSDIDNFMLLAQEMYHMAYDTTQLISPDYALRKMEQAFPHTDTIPMLVMDYEFYSFKPDALTTDIYFEFDTLNNTLTDKVNRPDFPYLTNRIFTASPLRRSTRFANVVFAFQDWGGLFQNTTPDAWNGKIIKIDFGDGQGWRVAKDAQGNFVAYHSVVYTTASTKIIRVGIFEPNAVEPFGASLSRLVVPTTAQTTPPNEVITGIDGIKVKVWKACTGSNPNPNELNKVVIYLQGYDQFDFWNEATTNEEEYQTMIKETQLSQLQNFGYDFVMVDWRDSGDGVRENSMRVVQLIHKLLERTYAKGNKEQFVMIGHSMGGIIGRYVLAYMESQEYLTTHSPSDATIRHNTRLLLTIDSPHQGANVPLSLQKMYKDILYPAGSTITQIVADFKRIFTGQQGRILRADVLLNSKFAKQMLIYHVDTEDTSQNNFYPTYTAHPERAAFLADIAKYGRNGYPERCKLVATTNGSLSNKPQTRLDYDGAPRTPNDYMVDFKGTLHVQIFGIRLPFYTFKLEVRTNPDGKGKLLHIGRGTYGIRLRLRKWGIRITAGSTAIGTNYERGADVRPVCIQSGGRITNGRKELKPIPSGTASNEHTPLFMLVGFFTRENNNGNGLYKWSGTMGALWTGVGVGARMYSDGFNFNFIPTTSGLDYEAPNLADGRRPLEGYNILQDDLETRLNRTPFDVIIGVPEARESKRWNDHHTDVRNEKLPTSLITCTGEAGSSTELVNAFALNREIGDQELYLDNATLSHHAQYTAEFDIHVNKRFPHYEYLDFTPTPGPDEINGNIFSKNDPFEISPSGFAFFRSENPFVQPPAIGNYQKINTPVYICCIDYSKASRTTHTARASKPTKETYLRIFPNPNLNRSLTVQYLTNDKNAVTITLRNAQGIVVANWHPMLSQYELATSLRFDLTPYHLPKGLYFVTLNNGKQQFTQKLILD